MSPVPARESTRVELLPGLRNAPGSERLWQREGRRGEAYRALREIYGWFTEGFDTADLREAKVLLQELA